MVVLEYFILWKEGSERFVEEDLNISVLVKIPNDFSLQVSLNEPSSLYFYAMLQDMPRQRIAWSVFSCSRRLALPSAEMAIMGKIRLYSRNHDIVLIVPRTWNIHL